LIQIAVVEMHWVWTVAEMNAVRWMEVLGGVDGFFQLTLKF